MKPIVFTITSQRALTIGNLLQSELFECASVAAKDTSSQPSADSLISDFGSVLFGVKGQSSFGFRLSFDGKTYQLSISPFATPSDWTGAIFFLKMLLAILEADSCQLRGMSYTVDTIDSFNFNSMVLNGISTIAKTLQENPQIQLDGVHRPIYINQLYFGQIVHVPDDQLLVGYDQRFKLTQQINAYYSEQQIFTIKSEEEEYVFPVNYLNSEVLTVLPAKSELTLENLRQFGDKKNLEARLFIINSAGNKLAEVPYNQFLESLSEGIFMLDAKYVVVEPFNSKLEQVLSPFR
ncbi:DUF4299 family protein [Streptococcus caprae]|uniref:DUF4299 family protein n=1 Tax=Streptococcus caprae TaxID=1640501 RepID=A0ABV8CW96_9STRE